jgi:hypothetical protein
VAIQQASASERAVFGLRLRAAVRKYEECRNVGGMYERALQLAK